ncbi:MAG: hypothetical protein IKA85_03110 [Clostridia bacterium]|nr:hypothetical protein [Clostridia bacterium]
MKDSSVIEIKRDSTQVATYTYDAWGNILTKTGSMADETGEFFISLIVGLGIAFVIETALGNTNLLSIEPSVITRPYN